jgi:hypothetical protein
MPSGLTCAAWLLAAAVFAAPSGPPASTPASETDEQVLKRLVRERLAAVARGDWSVWDRQLSERVVYAAEDGRVYTKSELKEDFRPLPPGYSGTLEPASFVVHVHGDAAVVSHEDLEHEVIHGQKLTVRYRTTDTFVRTQGTWLLVASQVLALADDPPALVVPAAVLEQYAGRYQLAPEVIATVSLEGDRLTYERSGRPRIELLPELDGVFFVRGQRGRKIFARDAQGRVDRILDRRDGHDVVWMRLAE